MQGPAAEETYDSGEGAHNHKKPGRMTIEEQADEWGEDGSPVQETRPFMFVAAPAAMWTLRCFDNPSSLRVFEASS